MGRQKNLIFVFKSPSNIYIYNLRNKKPIHFTRRVLMDYNYEDSRIRIYIIVTSGNTNRGWVWRLPWTEDWCRRPWCSRCIVLRRVSRSFGWTAWTSRSTPSWCDRGTKSDNGLWGLGLGLAWHRLKRFECTSITRAYVYSKFATRDI